MSNYYEKYIKYKQKYLKFKKNQEGGENDNDLKCYYKNIININNDNLVDILKNLNCKDIINLITSKKLICKFRSLTKEEWYQLIDNIKIDNYPYTYSTDNPEEPQYPYRSLMTQNDICNQNIYCRLFFTKCLHKHLIEKYNNNDLKQCWYQSIRKNNTDDYQYFDILIDTTKIGDSAFENNLLTSVIIPNSVKEIGYGAFENNELTSVTIPNSVTTIGNFAFTDNKLTSVSIPNSVKKIGWGAFSHNLLTEVIIPNSVTKIDYLAFSYNKLTSVTIPNSVKKIGERAFENNQLTEVIIPNSVTTIGNKAFSDNKLKEITIPYSVTIGYNAFDEETKIIRN